MRRDFRNFGDIEVNNLNNFGVLASNVEEKYLVFAGVGVTLGDSHALSFRLLPAERSFLTSGVSIDNLFLSFEPWIPSVIVGAVEAESRVGVLRDSLCSLKFNWSKASKLVMLEMYRPTEYNK